MVRRTRHQKIANREPLTIQTADVFHRDFTVAPDGTDNRVKFLALEAPESHAQILSVDHEGERSFVHVQNDCNIPKKRIVELVRAKRKEMADGRIDPD